MSRREQIHREPPKNENRGKGFENVSKYSNIPIQKPCETKTKAKPRKCDRFFNLISPYLHISIINRYNIQKYH